MSEDKERIGGVYEWCEEPAVLVLRGAYELDAVAEDVVDDSLQIW